MAIDVTEVVVVRGSVADDVWTVDPVDWADVPKNPDGSNAVELLVQFSASSLRVAAGEHRQP